MYLVMVLCDNRVNHIMPFDPSVWNHPDTAWELACDHAHAMVRELGFDLPSDYWVKGSGSNEFRWSNVSVAIERAYTPTKSKGAISLAKAYADADGMRKSRECE